MNKFETLQYNYPKTFIPHTEFYKHHGNETPDEMENSLHNYESIERIAIRIIDLYKCLHDERGFISYFEDNFMYTTGNYLLNELTYANNCKFIYAAQIHANVEVLFDHYINYMHAVDNYKNGALLNEPHPPYITIRGFENFLKSLEKPIFDYLESWVNVDKPIPHDW